MQEKDFERITSIIKESQRESEERLEKKMEKLIFRTVAESEINLEKKISGLEFQILGVEERLEKRIDDLKNYVDRKFNKLMEHITDLAGQFKKFDEERVVLAHRQAIHSDKIEKLEQSVFQTS